MNSRLFNHFMCLLVAAAIMLCAACSRKQSPQPQQTSNDSVALIEENNRGVALMGQFNYTVAATVFEQLVNKHPDNLDLKVNLAIATLNRQNEGDESAALTLLKDVLAKDDRHLAAHYCAGILYFNAGENTAAKQHFEYVAQHDHKDAHAAYYIAQCLLSDGDYPRAIARFEEALQLDPYMSSAYWGAAQGYRRVNQSSHADAMISAHDRIKHNPRARPVELKYTRMGPKAMVITLGNTAPPSVPIPPGPLFASPQPLLSSSDQVQWNIASERPISVTCCDINGDGLTDVFIANAIDHPESPNAVCIQQADGTFTLDSTHVLAAVPGVRAALWGDYDNDGLIDVYLCRNGPNQLWRQTARNTWENVTAATATANGSFDTIDGAFIDADHDGDLDIFCVNHDGPNELLSNNLDGTFRPIAAEQGIAGGNRASRQVLFADIDSDRDLDIIIIHAEPPHEVFLNDRLWEYRVDHSSAPFLTAPINCIVMLDSDADGRMEFLTIEGGVIARWVREHDGPWLRTHEPDQPDAQALIVMDPDGDGFPDLLTSRLGRAEIWHVEHPPRPAFEIVPDLLGIAAFTSPGWRGPAAVMAASGAPPLIARPGPGRHEFVTLAFTGRQDIGQSMRSNASGIGCRVAARNGSDWLVTHTLRRETGPGQSLMPIAFGLNGAHHLDFIEVDWPDGLFQSEIHGIPPRAEQPSGLPVPPRNFSSGNHETIEEIQRQVSSCPVLFAWNGEHFEFVSDLLGVGGMGYMLAPGEYATPRPWENFLLPDGLAQPQGNRFAFKLGEPMEEACYLDAVSLVACDLPPGWQMTLDERMAILGPPPTGQPVFYRSRLSPATAFNDRGEDVTASILHADRIAAPVGELDHRFIGRLQQDHLLTLHFELPLDDFCKGGEPVLVIDGWVEYPYSQTMFAAWQAGAEYRAPTIEARTSHGEWITLLEQFGYPAGMPRQMSVPLPDLPRGTTSLRISTNQEVYFDSIAVVRAEPCRDVKRITLPLLHAVAAPVGFATRTTGPQRLPHYDYNARAPFWDTRHQAGYYTAFGVCTPLVANHDDALAIFGPGEEVHLEFEAELPPLDTGWSRRLILQTRGWCKDMDLFTQHGETLEPLPRSGAPSEHSNDLHRRFNWRYREGK